MMKTLAGIFPYLVSPVDVSTGHVRERVLRDLVEHLVARGVHGLSPLGSTGEVFYLSCDQRREIVRLVIDAAARRVPVVPGVAAYSTHEAIRQAQTYVDLGADGVVVMLQTQFPVASAGVESYFRAVANSVNCPIVLYTNPVLGTAALTPEMVVTLSELPNVRYMKDASGNTGRILTILNRLGDRIGVFSASAHIPAVVFRLGGVGWMAGPACVIPDHSVRLYELAQKGQWDMAFALQRSLWAMNELFQKYSMAACIKAALQIQGFDVGDPIAPQQPLSRDAVQEIAAELHALKP